MGEYIDYTHDELSTEVLRVISSDVREIGKNRLRELLDEIKSRVMVLPVGERSEFTAV